MTRPAKKTTPGEPATSALFPAMAAGHPAARLWLQVMAESTRFISGRLQTDFETQKAMLCCQNPVDLVQLQSEFVRKAVEQYASEAQRMFEIMTKATEDTKDAVNDTKTGTKRGYDDVPV